MMVGMTSSTALEVAIVGGGVSGLATAYWLRDAVPEGALCVLEKAPAAGGKVRSSLQDGFVFDWGPNGFVDSASDTLELIAALDLSGELQGAAEQARTRFVYFDGGLRPLPSAPGAFLRSELLSWPGKVRAILEFWRGSRHAEEESVHAFLARHFGPEAAEAFAELAVTGVAAGDPERLSLDALFPRFRALEREHGSLLRGLRALRQRQGENGSSRLTSFRTLGVGRLTGALAEALGEALLTGAEVSALEPTASGYALELTSGERLEARQVVLATPAFVSAGLLGPFAPEAAALLESIPYADVAVFGLGFDRIDVPRELSGFGFLVPRGQGVRGLGVLWSSSIFPDQAPAGKVMLRAILGGSLDPEFLTLNDEAALEVVRRDLELTMGITAEPEFVAYMRWPKGIPQYELGHRRKLAQLREALAEHPNLLLTGNAYEGIAVNDCLRNARQLSRQLAANLR